MKKILIEDFISELKKINNDPYYVTECVYTMTGDRTRYIKPEHSIIVADKLLAETNASDLDVRSFIKGFHKLLDGEKEKLTYYDGVTVGVWAR